MKTKGFTLVELVVVIVLLGILAASAVPRFLDISQEARIASLERVGFSIRTMINLVKARARIDGISPIEANPGDQMEFLVNTNIGQFEVDWRNLCPESRAELGDQLTTLDFLRINQTNVDGFETRVTNQSTWIGYEIPPGQCYVVYDSFACTVNVVSTGC